MPKFVNWAGNQQCEVTHLHRPVTEEEITAIIRRAQKVRFVGTAHSWSAVCVTGDTLIDTSLYNKIIELDREAGTITFQSGLKLWQLNDYLDKAGFALRNLGSISGQSAAGAIGTGTHGSGINFRILASQVMRFTLITANGDKMEIDAVRHPELFHLAAVSLGALGFISEITVKVVPAFRLREQSYVEDFDTALGKLDEYLHQSDHFKLWWFPHTDKMVVYRQNHTLQAANDSRLRQWLVDEVISVYAYRLFVKLGTLNRNWRPGINKLLMDYFIKPLDRIEKSYKVFNVPEPPRHREAEWAFDIRIAGAVLQAYRTMIRQSPHRINFLQEIRFTKADEFALSPCYGRDSVWVGCYNIDNHGWEELLRDFEQVAMRFDGRPHWGKEFTCGPEYLRKQYPGWDAFCGQRQALDPEGKFENEFIRTIFRTIKSGL